MHAITLQLHRHKTSTLSSEADRRIAANFVFLNSSEVLSQGRQPACAVLPPSSLKWFLPTQALSTWLRSLLIGNLSFLSSSGPPLSPRIFGGQVSAAEQWCSGEAGQGNNVLETLVFLFAFCPNAGVQHMAVWGRLFLLLLQSNSNRLKVPKKKRLPTSSNSNCFSVPSCLCTLFWKPSYISVIYIWQCISICRIFFPNPSQQMK